MEDIDIYRKFPAKERRPFMEDGFVHIPWDTDLSAYTIPPLLEMFGDTHPLKIEYCSGNGSWITEQAQKNPHINFFAVEKRFDRALKIWRRMKRLQIPNLVPVWSEGHTFTKACIPNDAVDTVYINFPDPWPKQKHKKNRLLTDLFVQEIYRILLPQGKFILVTDDVTYSEHFILEMQKQKLFVSTITEPFYTLPPEDYGSSFFRELFEKRGKESRYHLYEKAARL